MIIEKSNFEIPEHLNEEYFINVVQNGLKLSNIEIDKITFALGSSAGENYCSQIYRVSISFTQQDSKKPQEFSVIVKDMVDIVKRKSLMEFYESEVTMYSKIIPELHKIMGNEVKFAPKLFYFAKYPIPSVVLEDLGSLNYKIADRVTGLDEQASHLVMQKIAEYHAASMVLAKKKPSLIGQYQRSIFHDSDNFDEFQKKMRREFFFGNIKHVISALKKFPEFKSILEKLKNIADDSGKIYKLVNDASDRKNIIRVLNHGDMWVNNMLFQSNTNGPCDVTFIDFQLPYYGSLGFDLQYFLQTSLQLDVLKTKRDELLQTYYKRLKLSLRELKYSPIPSWDDVNHEIRSTEFIGFLAAQSILPLISMDRDCSKNNSLDNTKHLIDQIQSSFSNYRIIEVLKICITRCNEMKLFE